MEYVGITNEHDFYSQHYLDEIFEGDVSDLMAQSLILCDR